MTGWLLFWQAALIVSGIAFACITVVVAWKGFADLRAMFSDLAKQRK